MVKWWFKWQKFITVREAGKLDEESADAEGSIAAGQGLGLQ